MTLDMQAVSKNCPILIRLVRELKVSELIPKHKILDKRLDSYEPFDEKICRATAIPSDRALKLSCTMVCILGFCIHQTYSLKIISAGGLECLMLQIDASLRPTKFFSDYFFISS